MGSSTILLILRSLLPFLKEVVFKDKVLKDILLENKLATALTGCVLFMFLLLMYSTDVADNAVGEASSLKQTNGFLTTQVTDLQQRVKDLEDERRGKYGGKSAMVEGPDSHHLPTPAPDPLGPVKNPAVKVRKVKADPSLKAYVESRLKSLE